MNVLVNLLLLFVAAFMAGLGIFLAQMLLQTVVVYANLRIERRAKRKRAEAEEAARRRLVEEQNAADDQSIARTGAPVGADPVPTDAPVGWPFGPMCAPAGGCQHQRVEFIYGPNGFRCQDCSLEFDGWLPGGGVRVNRAQPTPDTFGVTTDRNRN